MVHIKLNRNESILNGANVKKLKEFRRQQLFTDVILICEDKLHHAHKIVITASANNNNRMKLLFPNLNYSTVLMTGVSPHDVENLLCFLYAGEIWIPPKEVEGLLKAARILQVDRIERNSEVEIPSDMLFQNPENEIQTPLQNIHYSNTSHALSNRRRAGPGNTRNVALESQADQENVYYDSTRSMNISHYRHNNTQESSRISTNMSNTSTVLALQHHQRQRQKTTILKKKSSSFSSKHPPEKFRAAVHFNDGDELINSPCENEDVTPIENYRNSIPSPTDTPVRAVTEDSWNVFQLTDAGNADIYDYSTENDGDGKIRDKSSENSRHHLAPKTALSFYSSKVSHPKTSTPTNKGEKHRSMFYSPSLPPRPNEDGPSCGIEEQAYSKNIIHHESSSYVTPTSSKTRGKEMKTPLRENTQNQENKGKNINEEFFKKQDTNERFLRSKNNINNANTNDDNNQINNRKCYVSSSTPFPCYTARTIEDQMKSDIMSSGREIRILLHDFRKQRGQTTENGNIENTKGKANIRSDVKRPKPQNLNNKKKKLLEMRHQECEIESSNSRKSESVDKRKVLRARKPRECTTNNNGDSAQIKQPTKRLRTTTDRGMKTKQAENLNIQERLRKRVKKVAV